MKQLVLIGLVGWCVVARAGTPTLTTYDAKSFTVSVPKAWTVVADASKGMVVAQQDPKRKDAAQVLVVVASGSNTSTDDQLLDGVLKQIAGAKVVKRDPLPGGAGKLVVADGTVDNIKVRLGAIAMASSNGVILGMLISKTGEFDALGGTNTVVAVLASIKVTGTQTATTREPTTSGEVMTPTYDSYKNLIVPAPRRAITQADLAGEWKNTGKSVKGYVNTSTGGYAGYSAVVADTAWTIDAKGNLSQMYNGVHASNSGGGTFQVNGDTTGTLAIGSDRVITVVMKGSATKYYLLRGWFVGPEMTVMRLNGPYYATNQIADSARKDETAGNLDEMWVRKTR